MMTGKKAAGKEAFTGRLPPLRKRQANQGHFFIGNKQCIVALSSIGKIPRDRPIVLKEE
jgi:hypothetical protein